MAVKVRIKDGQRYFYAPKVKEKGEEVTKGGRLYREGEVFVCNGPISERAMEVLEEVKKPGPKPKV